MQKQYLWKSLNSTRSVNRQSSLMSDAQISVTYTMTCQWFHLFLGRDYRLLFKVLSTSFYYHICTPLAIIYGKKFPRNSNLHQHLYTILACFTFLKYHIFHDRYCGGKKLCIYSLVITYELVTKLMKATICLDASISDSCQLLK